MVRPGYALYGVRSRPRRRRISSARDALDDADRQFEADRPRRGRKLRRDVPHERRYACWERYPSAMRTGIEEPSATRAMSWFTASALPVIGRVCMDQDDDRPFRPASRTSPSATRSSFWDSRGRNRSAPTKWRPGRKRSAMKSSAPSASAWPENLCVIKNERAPKPSRQMSCTTNGQRRGKRQRRFAARSCRESTPAGTILCFMPLHDEVDILPGIRCGVRKRRPCRSAVLYRSGTNDPPPLSKRRRTRPRRDEDSCSPKQDIPIDPAEIRTPH